MLTRTAVKWKGKAVFGPHINLDRMYEAREEYETRTPH